MAAPTEREIFDCLETNFRLAAENCEKLALSPKRGQIYLQFRDQLSQIEACCRQAGYSRGGDARWLPIGMKMAEAHRLAGEWLRGVKIPGTQGRRPLSEGQKHPMFMALAEHLRALQKRAQEFRDKKTGRTGPILPVMRQASSQRETTPIGWRQTAGGLVVPAAI